MKKIKKILIILSCLFCLPTSFVTANEPERSGKGITIKFKELSFETNDYKAGDVVISYDQKGLKEYVHIFDATTKQLLETMSVEKTGYRNSNIRPWIFKRSSSYGNTKIELSINVELYNYGSFREIVSLRGHYLTIAESVTDTRLENYNVNVWSPKDRFPTLTLSYIYNGTLVAVVNNAINASAKFDLLGAGFSISRTEGRNTYYRRTFDSTGQINLYEKH